MMISFLKHTVALALLLILGTNLWAQPVGIGQWRDYLPYQRANFAVDAGDKAYAATDYAIIVFDKTDNSIERLTTVNGLSDFGVGSMAYHAPTQTVIVGYENGNLDLINGNTITNMADVKRSSVLADKRINRIIIENEVVYLATGFGIVVLNLERKEVQDRYVIGNNGAFVSVNDIAFDDTRIYAATTEGIYAADRNDPNLSIFSSWTRQNVNLPIEDFSLIFEFEGTMYANYQSPSFNSDSLFELNQDLWQLSDRLTDVGTGSVQEVNGHLHIAHSTSVSEYDENWQLVNNVFTYGDDFWQSPAPQNCILSDDGTYWIADRNQGLMQTPKDNQWESSRILPDGPRSARAVDITIANDEVWVAPGGRNGQWSNQFFNDGVFSYIDNEWDFISKAIIPALDSVFDLVAVTPDPINKDRVYAASIGSGLIEFTNRELSTIYDEFNSELDVANIGFAGWTTCTDVQFDQNGVLWMTNSRLNDFLLAKTQDNEFYNYDFTQLNLGDPATGHLMVTSNNQKWVEIPGTDHGVVVFDDNGTLDDLTDDRSIVLNQNSGTGGLPSNQVLAMAEDLDGEVWVGTDAGIAVFFSPESVFDGTTFGDAQRILITQGGFTGYLLETQTVLCIAVDGADRKWVGTDGAGVFLLSPDGTEELLSFTTDNSPLFSNVINDITIDPATGEVFIATEEGILSYRGEATGADFEFGDVKAFPNPVRHSYEGPIAIRGLARDASVKITDISGNLVYETIAQGGQAVWDGKDFNGRRPNTGVYLVFAGKQDGLDSFVTKILFVN